MPRSIGSKNKIASEVKSKLQILIDDLIGCLNLEELMIINPLRYLNRPKEIP